MSKKSYTVDEFCEAYRISRAFLYKLWDNGLGPRYYKLGARRFIAYDAADEWQKDNESLASQAS